jgi:hypothetical protein
MHLPDLQHTTGLYIAGPADLPTVFGSQVQARIAGLEKSCTPGKTLWHSAPTRRHAPGAGFRDKLADLFYPGAVRSPSLRLVSCRAVTRSRHKHQKFYILTEARYAMPTQAPLLNLAFHMLYTQILEHPLRPSSLMFSQR